MAFNVMDCDAMLSGRQAAMLLNWWYLSTGLTGPDWQVHGLQDIHL